MTAAPCPVLVQQCRSLQEFGVETILAQALINTIRSIGSVATLEVPDHEARSVACSILADSKAVYSFPHILPATSLIATCDPLAFGDGVGIVVADVPKALDQENWNVSSPIGLIKIRSRKRLGSG